MHSLGNLLASCIFIALAPDSQMCFTPSAVCNPAIQGPSPQSAPRMQTFCSKKKVSPSFQKAPLGFMGFPQPPCLSVGALYALLCSQEAPKLIFYEGKQRFSATSPRLQETKHPGGSEMSPVKLSWLVKSLPNGSSLGKV